MSPLSVSDAPVSTPEATPEVRPEAPTAQHVREASTLILGKVIATLSDAIVPILLVRLLGKHEVGVLVGVLLTYGTLATVITAGFPATLMYHLATRDEAGRGSVARLTTACMFALGVFAALGLAAVGLAARIGATRWAPGESFGSAFEGAELMLGLALYPLGELPSRLLQNLFIVEGRATRAMAFGLFKSVGTTLATVGPIALGGGLGAVVGALSAFGLVQAAVVLAVLRALYAGVARVPADVGFRELFRFAMPVGITDVISTLNASVDRYLVMLVYPIAVLADYQAGAWQIPIITSIPYMVAAVYTPMYTRLLAEGRAHEAIAIWRGSVVKVSLLVVPLTAVFIVGAEETMELLFTAHYTSAASVFRWYAVFTLGRVAAFGPLLIAAGKPDFVMRAALQSLLGNVLVSVPLMALVGFVGPAMGTALSFVPMVIFYCRYVARATGLPLAAIFPLEAYLRVVGLAIVPALLAWAAKRALHLGAALELAIEATILLGSFALLGTLRGIIGREDWATVRGLFGRAANPEADA